MNAAAATALQPVSTLQSTFGEKTISDLVLMFRAGLLNLQPGFQRKSVWSWTDRRRLIQSIVSGYPLPSIFLYERQENGAVVYDVIDGKQRLESIFMFLGEGSFRSWWFNARLDFGQGDGREWWSWKEITKREPGIRAAFQTYKLPYVQVRGDMADINDLFVRINSTGKPLTSGEKRHAKYYNSRFLKQAETLVKKNRKFLINQKILSTVQLDRMKGTELFSELLISVQSGGIINKKTALDKAIGNASVNAHTLHRVSKDFTATLNTVKRIFGKSKKGDFFKTTRFRNTAEFYSLFMLVWQMRVDKLVLSDRRRNEAAVMMLRKLGAGVDGLRDQLRKAKPAKSNQRLYADYLLTVQGDTDSSATRQRRAEILRGMLIPLFERKDSKRSFSPEQRRIIWDREEQHYCNGRDCPLKGRPLSWEDITIDHILAWMRGGKTTLANAQLLCKNCNSRKGSK